MIFLCSEGLGYGGCGEQDVILSITFVRVDLRAGADLDDLPEVTILVVVVVVVIVVVLVFVDGLHDNHVLVIVHIVVIHVHVDVVPV